MEAPLSGPEIEAKSMEIIKREVGAHPFSEREWPIVSRMIHTTGDLEIWKNIRFSPDAITAAVAALKGGKPIIVDSNMIRSGISLPRLKSTCEFYRRESIICHIADEDIERASRRTSLPRSLLAIQKARPLIDGAIAAFGNAPVALMELNRMIIEEGIKPAVIIAMPVGFVHVVESKEELMTLGLPYIAIAGRRGGSPLAVSVINALCGLAS
jgi:precorrin isomerase